MDRRDLLGSVDPVAKFGWAIFVSALAATLRRPEQTMALACLVVLTALLFSRVSLARWVSHWRLLLAIPGGLFLFHVLLTSREVMTVAEGSQAATGAFAVAFVYSSRIFCSATAGLIFVLTTDVSDFVRRLRELGVPRDWVYSLSLMLTFFPIIANDARRLRTAQSARKVSNSDVSVRVRLVQRFLLTLVSTALRRAHVTARAMDARGFNLESQRSFLREGAYTFGPTAAFLLFEVLTGATILLFPILNQL